MYLMNNSDGYNNRYLEGNLVPSLFSKIIIGCSSLVHMGSPTKGSWPGLQYQTYVPSLNPIRKLTLSCGFFFVLVDYILVGKVCKCLFFFCFKVANSKYLRLNAS